jgi:hypothetical protein
MNSDNLKKKNMAISEDRNVINKKAENILKYKKTTDKGRMWNVKPKAIPEIRANGTISKTFNAS